MRSSPNWFRWAVGVFVLAGVTFSYTTLEAQPSNSVQVRDLTLGDFLKRVVLKNESVQAKLLEVEIARRKARGEYGAFEPELFGSASRESNQRQNTVQQQSGLGGAPDFSERNNIYEGGLESLVPTGAKVRLGYSLHDLRNSLQTSSFYASRGATNGEFQTFFGLSLTQPLLKNAWFPANLASIRVAAMASDIAFQEYRRELMLIISTAEATYWNLYMAQEQVRFFQESVATAEKILQDNRVRSQAGVGSELDVLEAEAGLALRRSKLSDAEQKLYEASNKLISLYGGTVLTEGPLIHAVDRPQVETNDFKYLEAWEEAYHSNPDYRIQRQKLLQESARLAYAKNQRMPELNVKGSYGLNGLGETAGASWDDIEKRGWPSWSVGLELRFPLGGGIRGRNELAAARLRQKEALLSLHDVETQIANSLNTALHKIRSARQSAQSYQTVVKFNQNLLNSALARLEVGRVESRKVLDIEADLFEARNSEVDALVQYERAVLEYELVAGSVLKKQQLELTKRVLQSKTAQILQRGELTDDQYKTFINTMQREYEMKAPLFRPAGSSEDRFERLREALHQKMEELDQQ